MNDIAKASAAMETAFTIDHCKEYRALREKVRSVQKQLNLSPTGNATGLKRSASMAFTNAVLMELLCEVCAELGLDGAEEAFINKGTKNADILLTLDGDPLFHIEQKKYNDVAMNKRFVNDSESVIQTNPNVLNIIVEMQAAASKEDLKAVKRSRKITKRNSSSVTVFKTKRSSKEPLNFLKEDLDQRIAVAKEKMETLIRNHVQRMKSLGIIK